MNLLSTPRIGVVGAGVMGRGIVQLFAQAGHVVRVFDSFEGSAQKAVDHVNGMLQRLVEKGRMPPEQASATTQRMLVCQSVSELADCDVVIEAVVERLDAKRELFALLEQHVSPAAILASNTSSLVMADIAATCQHPARVAGLHFFNPVPLMKVAEVIAAVRTAPEVVERLSALVQGAGHRAVVVADQPGFLVNHAGRGLYTEGLRILEERVANHEEVDALMRDAAGFRMGPFELMDLTGLDVSGRVMESIYEQFQQEPRFRPSSLVPPRISAGLYGRKTQQGWYAYEGDRKVESAPRPVPAWPQGLRVWVDPAADHAEALRQLVTQAGGVLLETAAEDGLLLIQPWGDDASHYCAAQGLDATRCVAVDPMPSFKMRRTLMLTVCTRPDMRDAAHALLASDGTPVTLIQDSPGFVVQRVMATIINIACNIAQRGIASVADIEDAVKLGLGYPQGPLAWGDDIGAARVLNILRRMQAATGDPRYRPSLWLTRRAELGLSLLAAEAER